MYIPITPRPNSKCLKTCSMSSLPIASKYSKPKISALIDIRWVPPSGIFVIPKYVRRHDLNCAVVFLCATVFLATFFFCVEMLLISGALPLLSYAVSLA